MRGQGAHLTGAERRALAEFVTGQKLSEKTRDPNIGRCAGTPAKFDASRPAWNGWSPTPENWHFQPTAQAGLTAAQIPNLKLKWAFGYPDIAVAWNQPTVVSGGAYVGSQNGDVYVLDAKDRLHAPGRTWRARASALRSSSGRGRPRKDVPRDITPISAT